MSNIKSCKSAKAVNESNYNENLYLDLNIDVRRKVLGGEMKTGEEHFKMFGESEERYQANPKIYEMRKKKNELIKKIIKKGYDKDFYNKRSKFNFLKQNIKEKFGIIDTPNVSSNNYDGTVIGLIEKHKDGIVLDCGSGYRNIYYGNVVNYEITDYSTTDVIGVGEMLPFKSNSFDAVISVAVLEHVKDPFLCAKEIARVLRPGGTLYCAVPFLQPFHGFPHHYFNMTKEGVKTLFEDYLKIEKQEVISSVFPVWSLCWIVKSWSEGLKGEVKTEFLNMKMEEFCKDPLELIKKPFVNNLSEEKNFELASSTILIAKNK